ncbi:MAG: hypothetical protein NC248_01805 [Bacteroides sp.]|nr:hypothetical protein [Bacteroides sp.]MCM1390657.1 hypothetical protein [Bacteroides sp.]
MALLLLFGITTFSSCSDEEKLTPGENFNVGFIIDPADKSPEATIRRNFYENTGIFLLFNDTVRVYTDEYGVNRIETIDFGWNITVDGETEYSYDLLTTIEEKQKMTEIINRYFIPYINVENGQFKPFSVLLCSNLIMPDRYGDPAPASFINSWRCFGINIDTWAETEDDVDAKSAGLSLLQSLVETKLNEYSPELSEFFAVCDTEYEAGYISKVYPEWMDEQDIEIVYESGFLKYYPDYYDEPDYDEFPSERSDLKSFMDALFSGDETGFREKWNEYPKIIQKYELLKTAIENLGVNFNAVK